MTGAEMEEVLPSKFWEPTATEISTRPADTGDAIKAFLGDHAADILKHGCHSEVSVRSRNIVFKLHNT